MRPRQRPTSSQRPYRRPASWWTPRSGGSASQPSASRAQCDRHQRRHAAPAARRKHRPPVEHAAVVARPRRAVRRLVGRQRKLHRGAGARSGMTGRGHLRVRAASLSATAKRLNLSGWPLRAPARATRRPLRRPPPRTLRAKGGERRERLPEPLAARRTPAKSVACTDPSHSCSCLLRAPATTHPRRPPAQARTPPPRHGPPTHHPRTARTWAGRPPRR